MGLKILTVDDSKTIRMIVKKAFRPYDCQIVEGENGVEGLALAAKEKPDLIILDITMPVMTGAEMLAKMKEEPELKDIPVIMLQRQRHENCSDGCQRLHGQTLQGGAAHRTCHQYYASDREKSGCPGRRRRQ